jgi:hypothetical protein
MTNSCPKCGGSNISYQLVQTGSIGAGTNRVVIEAPKKSHGLLYWCSGAWVFKFVWLIAIGWWWRLLFGGKKHSGLNFHVNKNRNKTMAICQTCGHTWKVAR